MRCSVQSDDVHSMRENYLTRDGRFYIDARFLLVFLDLHSRRYAEWSR